MLEYTLLCVEIPNISTSNLSNHGNRKRRHRHSPRNEPVLSDTLHRPPNTLRGARTSAHQLVRHGNRNSLIPLPSPVFPLRRIISAKEKLLSSSSSFRNVTCICKALSSPKRPHGTE
ncbi:hypothetical protein AMELA_G00193990 [Ameiurus melas]|uniref:Uncharacterized protein n=1 Tax=Ameiurus melas TaxID=219545 RepID=A0A7J6A550_AMEME|nr:hypothetical protein AMELA_G00193990 [Ameiurus melas]